MTKEECTHTIVAHETSDPDIDGRARILSTRCARLGCNAQLSLGPSNDDIPFEELMLSVLAVDDQSWERWEWIEREDGERDWDPSRPLAEQWPWNGEKLYDGLWTKAQLAEMDREEDDLRAQAIADRKAEEHAELVGPTDQGQPLIDAECAAIIAQSSDSYEPFDGGMTGYIDPGQLQRFTEMCGPVNTVPLVVKLDGGEPFVVDDFADKQPWADPEATTRLTDDELVKTVAYCPPGSVQDDEMRCCPREAWGDGTHDLDCPKAAP